MSNRDPYHLMHSCSPFSAFLVTGLTIYINMCAAKIVDHMSLVLRKPVFGVSDQVRYKAGCTATEDGQRLEISDL